MATTQIPNMNPTGVIGSGAGNAPMMGQPPTGFSGTGGPGNMGFGNGMNPTPPQVPGQGSGPFGTPHAASSPTAASTMNPGGGAPSTLVPGQSGQQTSTQNPYDQTQHQQQRTLGELQTYYGEGMGSLIFQYLNSGGGFNSALTQQAVDSQTNAMQQQIGLGANDLTSRLGAMGISGGSELTGALTNYENQAMTQENAITSQEYYTMWNASQDRELSLLKDTAQVNATGTANQSNWMDYLNTAVGVAGLALGV